MQPERDAARPQYRRQAGKLRRRRIERTQRGYVADICTHGKLTCWREAIDDKDEARQQVRDREVEYDVHAERSSDATLQIERGDDEARAEHGEHRTCDGDSLQRTV